MDSKGKPFVRVDWCEVRNQFEVMPGAAYLNTGTCGRTPRPVLEVAADWRRRLAAEPCEVLWRQLPEWLWPARQRLARFVGAEPEQVSFMANVTAGVNTLASGLKLDPGRDVLVTDQEYGAMVYAWERAARRAGAAIRTIELPVGPRFTRQELLDRFDAALAKPAQLLFLSHITTATGLVLPIREICNMARSRGVLTVVDGAHAPGMIPVNIRSLGCDFYAGNGHKWLLAPVGVGFLYIRPGLEERVEPLVVSWGWKYDRAQAHQRDQDGSTPYIRSHEFQGVRDPAPWLATSAAIDFVENLGLDQIEGRDRELAGYARGKLVLIPGVEPALPEDPTLAAALVAYRLPAGNVVDL
ncbi:MAG: aminotransferase class V-fold PLP-dependent enzyme, partial [Planctomycetes bacterium]|nr:aminotransferase class V-fold PLP-dependent enzyme [Planctomycetota bacterium]